VNGDQGPTGPQGIEFVGSIIYYLGEDDPYGWLTCDGRTISDASYSALVNVLGGFVLPNLPRMKDTNDVDVTGGTDGAGNSTGGFIIKY
jgi:microcystin-dependent protein